MTLKVIMCFLLEGLLGRHSNESIWNATPLCIILIIWRERTNWTFNGVELSTIQLKCLFLRSSYE